MNDKGLSVNFESFCLRYLINAELSDCGIERSSDQPFFTNDNRSKKNKIGNNKREISTIHRKLNRNIHEIYKYTKSDDQEIYLYDWTFMSIKEVKERYKSLCAKRSDIIDVAYKYHGLGWIVVLSCDLNNSLLFERMDGGSNGWDRENNFNKLIMEGSKPYKKVNFSQWVNKLSHDMYE